jgi:microcystin-dependent protein
MNLGTISAFAFQFAPAGWAPCDGSLMAIEQNVPLFEVIGTRYGGDGRVTFALPDMRGTVTGKNFIPFLSIFFCIYTGK